MRILCIGDVVGGIGVEALAKKMPEIRSRYSPDMIIVNGENAGENSGICEKNANALFALGADVITGGNHSLQNRDMTDLYERECGVIRPANLHPNAPGSGVYVYERGKNRCAVINLIGNVFLDLAFESPFLCLDRLLKDIDCKNIVVDIHGEATSEKIALGRYADGKVSAVFGTHTHVPTADECILPEGTAFITDAGMCGPIDSVLGVKTEVSTNFMITHLRTGMQIAGGPCKVQGIFVETENSTGRAVSIERFDLR
ncbi:MAG: YmdB family metallophosphoesterase [Oscillospiraceae bacterium]